MIVEEEMIHGCLPRQAAPRAKRNRVPSAPAWQPGFGEWDVAHRNHQEPQANRTGAGSPVRERIPAETGIGPRAVSAAVCEEAGLWLGVSLPQAWVDELAGHAEVIYEHNPRFRALLRGNRGPNRLWAFNRHWLHAILQSRCPDLAARLPASYANGHDLPQALGVRP